MALTEAEKESVRYYCGYGMLGLQALPASGYRFSVVYGTMEYKMVNLQPGEEDQVRNFYLVTLDQLKTDIVGVRDNLDTTQAAVWTWNKKELPDRIRLYNYWRLQLCAYLGLPPGDGLASGAVSLAI